MDCGTKKTGGKKPPKDSGGLDQTTRKKSISLSTRSRLNDGSRSPRRRCRVKQKTKMNLTNYKLKGAYSKDEFTDIKSFKERVNDFIELVEKDNARRIRIDFTIEWEIG